ncbi:MAG TPA: 2-dehydro-3-deoxygalactonokinase [Verrucomicrobiae bacterium]|nr:2-dehydro-3-deoxygalactonokinase [Verrucomicrobiae bacterium]
MSDRLTFLSCDWGTSSFRLRLIEDEEVLRESRMSDGCRSIFERLRETGAVTAETRARAFGGYLNDRLAEWSDLRENRNKPIPLVISGMASSTIGWQEIPYAAVPLRLDGSNLRASLLDWEKPFWVNESYLIGGVATSDEIMRGEEIEAIGLLADEQQAHEACLLVLPGTHSKHLLIRDREIVDFCTHMTGELFEALANHTVLRATVDLGSLDDFSEARMAAFDLGLRSSVERGLGRSLFQTRTRAVLKNCPKAENSWFLSGVLIGAELQDLLAKRSGLPVLLAGVNHLRRLYARAMRILTPSGAGIWRELPAERIQNAVALGHRLFLAQRKAPSNE